MTIYPAQLFLGFALACAIAIAAWRVNLLSNSGATAAVLLGTVVFGFGGLGWAVLLIAFFSSSSLLSRFRKGSKNSLSDKFSKGSRRDASQVLANGGIAGLFALLNAFFPASPIPWLGFAASLAAANADTWATELGVLAKQVPRLITTWKVVERGESGGITGLGSLAALAGAFFVAAISIICFPFYFKGASTGMPGFFPAIITIAGFAGAMLDSVLGASLQAGYYCPACNKRTEQSPEHACGSPTTLVSGQAWLNNDAVNAFCAASGAGVAIILWLMTSQAV